MENYNDFAYIYDQLMDDFDYELWHKYLEDILLEFKKKPKNILEMACGTGNLTYYFAKDGYKISAFDKSTDMLTIADAKLKEFKNVSFLSQDMVDFDIREKFDLIYCVCDSINYIKTYRDLLKTFTNVKKHLKEDGIFIFDINSYHKLKNIIGNNTFVEDRENLFYVWDNYYDDQEDHCEFYLTFFQKNKNDSYRRIDEIHIEKAYKTKEVREVLKNAGFEKIFAYDAFTFEKVREDSERINFVVLNR